MTLYKLGRNDEAETQRTQLLELMKDPEHANDDQSRAFVREVETLFGK